MKPCRALSVWLYIINLSLLTTHEIDSAYWHEWEMFRLPGGEQFFLVINLVLLIPLTYGLTRVVRWQRGAMVFSYITAGAGIFAFIIHSIFLASGGVEFRAPVSLAILAATLIVSMTQMVFVARCAREAADMSLHQRKPFSSD
jgi:Kef-type K+ transport system membrane component KefB